MHLIYSPFTNGDWLSNRHKRWRHGRHVDRQTRLTGVSSLWFAIHHSIAASFTPHSTLVQHTKYTPSACPPELQRGSATMSSQAPVKARGIESLAAPPRNLQRKGARAGSERFRWSRMQSMISRSSGRGFERPPSYEDGEWHVPSGYDYSKPTNKIYAAPSEDEGMCFGRYQAVRRSRDFKYHGTYSRERQLFQGQLTCGHRASPAEVLYHGTAHHAVVG